MGPMPPLLIFAIVFWSTALIGGIHAVRRYLRILERRAGNEVELVALRERVVVLEESLEDVRVSVERLDAGQEFTTRLLNGRAGRGEQDT
jgi:hypothetical protein